MPSNWPLIRPPLNPRTIMSLGHAVAPNYSVRAAMNQFSASLKILNVDWT